MNWKQSFVFILLILLVSCVQMQMAQVKGRRDCLVKAVGYKDAYENDHQFDPYRWSRVLGIFWDDERRMGHAVAVYLFEGKIMVQGAGERRGGWTLTHDLRLKDDPLALAKLYAPGTPVREAYYFEDL